MPQQGKRQADFRLLTAFACGATVEQAAAKTGLSESTVYRRLKDPEFVRQLQAMKSEMVQRTAAALTAAAMEGVKTLMELLKPVNTGPTRLGAAKAILEVGVKLRELAELEDRLAALEARVGDGRGGRAA
jgi:hypothetical protein